MVTLLGIVDRTSILAYLGRPQHRTKTTMDQTVKYPQAIVQKTHTFYKRLAAKKGYIELFNLGYIYLIKDVWWVHWKHVEQLTLSPPPASPLLRESSECVDGLDDTRVLAKASIENISLTNNTIKGSEVDVGKDVDIERQKRERVLVRERNSVIGESNHRKTIIQHSEKPKLINLSSEELAILRASKEDHG